jgi:phage/conjugal plasmid C-4 type zinc finger TraR family protein
VSDLGNRAFELAAQRAEQERDAGIARSIAELSTPGAVNCIDCSEPIGAARRAALPSAQRCVHCQARQERGN